MAHVKKLRINFYDFKLKILLSKKVKTIKPVPIYTYTIFKLAGLYSQSGRLVSAKELLN